MNFGDRIKELRTEKQWTQEFVAEKLNISMGALSRYETGMYEPKSLDLVKDFAVLFDVSTDYLLCKSDIRNPGKVDIDEADIAFASGVKALNDTNKMIIKNTLEALLTKQEKDGETKEDKK